MSRGGAESLGESGEQIARLSEIRTAAGSHNGNSGECCLCLCVWTWKMEDIFESLREKDRLESKCSKYKKELVITTLPSSSSFKTGLVLNLFW